MVTFLWILLIIFIVLLPPFMYLSKKYRNPYRLIMVFGKKGSGKTTLLAKTAYKGLKKGKTVYSTEQVPGVIRFDADIIGQKTFPENSVVLLDEAGMKFDSRDFKTFPKSVRNYFKYQRHEKNTVYLFSQSFDLDKKIRDLTDEMYLCTCHFSIISIARRIKKNFKIVEASAQGESRIADNLEFEPLWLSLFGVRTCIVTFIPHWSPLFNSHEKLGIPVYEKMDVEPIPEAAAKMFKFLDPADEDEVDQKSFLTSAKDFIKFLTCKRMKIDPEEHIPDLHPDFDPDEIHIMDVEDL